jgi:hypothetical protein
MQIAEDVQLMVGHMIMQWLEAHPPWAVDADADAHATARLRLL